MLFFGHSPTCRSLDRGVPRVVCSPLLRPRRSTEHRVEKPVEPTAESIWDDVSRRLRDTLNETTYQTWFASSRPLALRGDSFVVAVPNDFTRGWIESHFLGLVSAAVRDSLGRDVKVALRVEEA